MGAALLVIAASSAAILLVHLVLCAGLVVDFARDRRLSGSRRAPRRVEAIVAVRDEQRNLPRLLESLRAQSLGDCGILLVDDRSTDATGPLIDEFCAALGPRARAIHIAKDPVGLTGKQAALDVAFAHAAGDILLFTDGDCAVPERWAECLARYFDDPAVGIVLGRIELAEGSTFCESFQAFVQPLINQYNFGAAGIELPLGCFGNNMAIRREAIGEVGGFSSIGYSVTEDSALLAAIRETRRWKVRASTLQEAVVTTLPKHGWREFIGQNTRWNAGAIFARDWKTRLSYALICFGYLTLSLLAIPFAILDARILIPALTSFASVGLLGLLGGAYAGKDRRRYFLRFIPYLVFFLFFYSFVSIRALFNKSLDWKGSVHVSGRRD